MLPTLLKHVSQCKCMGRLQMPLFRLLTASVLAAQQIRTRCMVMKFKIIMIKETQRDVNLNTELLCS